jgi:RecA-family ATPase
VPDIIDRIFPAYENHLTGGASGSGKTTLEAEIIEDWRHGKPIFGYRSFPAPFCYVACDRSLQSIQATLRRIEIPFEEWPIISLINQPINMTLAPIPQIIHLARKKVPDLSVVWLDGIHSLCPGGKINDYGVVQGFLTDITRLCQREKLTFKSLGHATKVREGESFLNPRHRFLGTVAWGGYSDTMTIIDQAKPEDPLDTTRNVYLLPRNELSQTIKYEIVNGKLTQVTDVADLLMDRWLLQLMASTILSTEACQTQAEKLHISRATCTRWIKRMVEQGKLQKQDRGQYLVSFTQ